MKKICPICKSKNIKKILYGLPGPEMFKDYEEGKILLGGCLITGYDPDYACLDCNHHWLSKNKSVNQKISSNN